MTLPFDQSNLVDMATTLVDAARKAGADAADAIAARGLAQSVEMRLGAVEETRRAENDDLTLRVFVGRRSAAVSANVVDDPAALAARAVAMARAAPEDRFAGLADPARLARSFPDLDLVDDTIPGSDRLTEMARMAEDAARAVAGVSNSGGASASWSLGGLVLVTSDGFSGSRLGSRFSVSATAIAGSGTAMERDYDFAVASHLSDLDAADVIGRRAGERAVARLNPGKRATGRATVMFDRRVSASFLGHLSAAASGSAIARRTSFLSGRRGEAAFSPAIHVVDDPKRRRGLASRPFDGEGVAAEPFDLVSEGVLTDWLLDSTSARELGLATNGRANRSGSTTSPGPTNLTLMPGARSPEALMAEFSEGVLVTDLIGHGVNLVTGDYSRGAAGFAIRGGKVAEPISGFTIAGNLKEIFMRLVPADDLQLRYAVNAPSLVVDGMTIAGN